MNSPKIAGRVFLESYHRKLAAWYVNSTWGGMSFEGHFPSNFCSGGKSKILWYICNNIRFHGKSMQANQTGETDQRIFFHLELSTASNVKATAEQKPVNISAQSQELSLPTLVTRKTGPSENEYCQVWTAVVLSYVQLTSFNGPPLTSCFECFWSIFDPSARLLVVLVGDAHAGKRLGGTRESSKM